MADIRQYRKDKRKSIKNDESGQNESEYDGRLRKHRTRIRFIAAAAVFAVIVLVVVLCIVNYGSGYKSYAVRNLSARNDSGYAQYINFDGGYVRCSKDGVAMYSYSGTQQWNRTYEMKSPIADVCGSYMAVADTDGNEIHLFDKNGYISTVNTALPIIQIRVSSRGMVAATLEDNDVAYISMYNSNGDKIYNIKSTVSGNGVPVSMDVSPDGHLLIVSFTSVEAQKLSTSVVFYNFGEVGQSEVERVVGGYDAYGEQLVADVKFISSSAAVAVGENLISFFKVGEYPKLMADITPDFTTNNVFYSDKYVGLEYTDKNNERKVNIYSTSGSLLATLEAGGQYSRYAFADDSLLMYGESALKLINMKGKVLFEGSLEEGIVELIPISGDNEFICVSPDKLMRIELKHGG